MSVAPEELISAVWTQWQGHVVDGQFRLGRHLGSSDHSGVFLTHSAALSAADVAIKLVPANAASAESQLSRWTLAATLDHQNLLRLLRCGKCELDGQPYLYVVMEYADQTLAQLLQRRALTDDEARETLPPILEALAFLHGQGLVQGSLIPENVLVVGDQLKLASDTIQRSSAPMSANELAARVEPQGRRASDATAGDIWALGACLLEALTRRAPSDAREGGKVALPADFSPSFKDVVERCLHPNRESRPSVAALTAWMSGTDLGPIPVAPVPPAVVVVPEPKAPEPPKNVAPVTVAEVARPTPVSKPRVSPAAAVLVAAAVIGLGWTAVSMLKSHRAPASPDPETTVPQAPPVVAPAAANVDSSPVSNTQAAAGTVLHQVIPEVSRSARRTIKGHIEVSVRVAVDPDGSVVSATAEHTSRSRYFPRAATEAARKWTFQPSAAQPRRMMRIQFEFSRDETTAHAEPE